MAEAIIRPPLPERPPLPVVSRELAVPAVSAREEARLSNYSQSTRNELLKLGDKILVYTGNDLASVGRFYDSVTRFGLDADALKAALAMEKIVGGGREESVETAGATLMLPLAFIAIERDQISKTAEEEKREAARDRVDKAANALDLMPMEKVSKQSVGELVDDVRKVMNEGEKISIKNSLFLAALRE